MTFMKAHARQWTKGGKDEPKVSVRGWGREGRHNAGGGRTIRGWDASLSETEVTCSDFWEFRRMLRQTSIHQKGIKDILWPTQRQTQHGPAFKEAGIQCRRG